MIIIRSISRMSRFAQKARRQNKTIGFVPTMGSLHAGHQSLIRTCRRENDITVVSVFVNPLQFGPQEDYRKYPRNLQQDARLCRKEDVDIIFYPDARKMYPRNHRTFVAVEDLSEVLCGKSRPGHFKGVVTVVAKLFNIVSPDTAYFGQKDAQQAIIIKKMVEDLNLPVRVKVLATVRQKNGLALSSRNVYLSGQEKKDALVLSKALNLAKGLIKERSLDASMIIKGMTGLIKTKKTARIDYISIVDPDSLLPVKRIKRPCLIALAVRFGRTRLIDNATIK